MTEYSIDELKIGSQDDMLANATKINKGEINMGNNINQAIENIIALYERGGNPQQIMQGMMQNNTQMGQIRNQLQNMAQGRSPMEFILQIAKQNGVSEKNLQGIARILGAKK